MTINDDKTKLKEYILEKLEEVQKMIREYTDEYDWQNMDDDVCVSLSETLETSSHSISCTLTALG